ncbi:MAG: pyruvoyl-dependent arginine decarboxylase, partial [Promethearchaeota archaeon]
MSLVPKKVFFVNGKGYHKSKLAAFEEALRDAGIEKYNLVNVSSILPP